VSQSHFRYPDKAGIEVKEREEISMTTGSKVEPLTRRRADGQVHQRDSEVEKQIAEAISIDVSQLIERVKIRDFKAPGYFQEEALVYLIRNFHKLGNDSLFNSLTQALIARCAKHINKSIEATVERRFVDDAYTDSISEVFSQILDLTSDRCDFAQKRFWFWLDRVLMKVLNRYWKQQAQDWKVDSLDDDRDEAKQAELWQTVDSNLDRSDTPELQAINSEALSILEPEERMLFMLRYYEEMEIENRDESVMTISKYFGISSRAVRYRLVNIKEKLRKWTEGAS